MSLWKAVPAALLAKLRNPAKKLIAFLHSAQRVHAADRLLPYALLRGVDTAWSNSAGIAASHPGSAPISMVLDHWCPTVGEASPVLASLSSLRLIALRTFHQAVRFCGPSSRDRFHEIAAHASFFRHLSRVEGMAMACIEAMHLRLVPVVTDVGETGRFARSGENGLVLHGTDPATGAALILPFLEERLGFGQ